MVSTEVGGSAASCTIGDRRCSEGLSAQIGGKEHSSVANRSPVGLRLYPMSPAQEMARPRPRLQRRTPHAERVCLPEDRHFGGVDFTKCLHLGLRSQGRLIAVDHQHRDPRSSRCACGNCEPKTLAGDERAQLLVGAAAYREHAHHAPCAQAGSHANSRTHAPNTCSASFTIFDCCLQREDIRLGSKGRIGNKLPPGPRGNAATCSNKRDAVSCACVSATGPLQTLEFADRPNCSRAPFATLGAARPSRHFASGRRAHPQ